MEIAVLNVFEDDYDYQYKRTYIVKNDEEKIKRLLEIVEDTKNMSCEEIEEKYGNESLIEITDYYISNNLEQVKCATYDIDLL